VRYFRLASSVPVDEVDKIEKGLADGTLDPNQTKRRLARNIVSIYHGEEAAKEAEEAFNRLFKDHAAPEKIPEFKADLTPNEDGKVYLAKIIQDAHFASSTGQARRLIDGGGVRINGQAVAPKTYNVDPDQLKGATLQVGKRHFIKLV